MRTDIHTHETTTVTLSAHVRRGLINVQEERDKGMIDLKGTGLKCEQEQLDLESP